MPSAFVLQHCLATIRNNYRVNQSTAFQDSHDCGFVTSASTSDAALALADVHVTSFATDESFVYFDTASTAANFYQSALTPGFANSMQHEPSRLLGYTDSLGNLVTANAVLASAN